MLLLLLIRFASLKIKVQMLTTVAMVQMQQMHKQQEKRLKRA